METEYARQTRWGHRPELIDPGRFLPGSCFAKQVLWVPCTNCDLQVHATVTQRVSQGVTCPDCGRRLLPPFPQDRQEEATAQIMAAEDSARL